MKPIVGKVIESFPSTDTGRYVSLEDLRAGWWNLTAEDTQVYYKQTDQPQYNRAASGSFLPRDECKGILVDKQRKKLCYFIPAGGTLHFENVVPIDPYKKPQE